MRGTIYNGSTSPQTIDRAGRTLEAGGRLEDVDLDAQPVKGHVAAARFIVIEQAAEELAAQDAADAEAAAAEDPSPEPEPEAKAKTAKTTTTRGAAATTQGS